MRRFVGIFDQGPFQLLAPVLVPRLLDFLLQQSSFTLLESPMRNLTSSRSDTLPLFSFAMVFPAR